MAIGGEDPSGYYAILEVGQDCTADEIKRQYFQLARKYHPDKNQDNPEAKTKFQALGEAYQVLANPRLRQQYDRTGADGLEVDFMDGVEFFGMLFGCEQFEYLIGEMFLATSIRFSGDFYDPALQRFQIDRVEKLSTTLKALLKRYEKGDCKGFWIAQNDEAKRLANVSFGKTMLYTIGRVYEDQANIFLGNFFQSSLAAVRQRGEVMRTHFQAVKMAFKVMNARRQIEKMEEETQAQSGQGSSPVAFYAASGNDGWEHIVASKDREEEAAAMAAAEAQAHQNMMRRAELQEAAIPVVLEAMWAANVIDIRGTIKKVCRRVLSDDTRPNLTIRAEALRMLGGIFVEHGMPTIARGNSSEIDAKSALEQAMMKVTEKRNAADDALYEDDGNTQ